MRVAPRQSRRASVKTEIVVAPADDAGRPSANRKGCPSLPRLERGAAPTASAAVGGGCPRTPALEPAGRTGAGGLGEIVWAFVAAVIRFLVVEA